MLPSSDPAFTELQTPGASGRGKSAFTRNVLLQYMDLFHQLLAEAEQSGEKIDIEEIENAFPDARPETVRKHLRSYLDIRLDDIRHVTGLFLSAGTIIRLAERDLGPISGETLSAANTHCKDTVDGISRPRHARFIAGRLADYADGEAFRVPQAALVDFLFDEYVGFIRESDNGLVSIAGSLNEAIFIRGLTNGGLAEGHDIIKTGTRSDGDLKIQHHGARGVELLYVEIKSYAARERLLRGLQDIQHPLKIGIGFFNNPAEFNPGRTDTLLAAGPLAIYMPQATWAALHPDSRAKVTRLGDFLYRPLEMFVADMQGFVRAGRLPSFNRLP
ncbi:MAG: hypothetical protein IT559_03175 [Alphaproteobacteria bacterium]|nr:hypothetical protein [Alphaproteobacteria bacterium]